MERPNLKQVDLDEVDRLVNIADSCNGSDDTGNKTKTNNIRIAALERAAQIMGIVKGDEDEIKEANKEAKDRHS